MPEHMICPWRRRGRCTFIPVTILFTFFLSACHSGPPPPVEAGASNGEALLQKYTPVRLSTDLSVLSESERRMIPLLIDAAREMDEIFWIQAYGERAELQASIDNTARRRFAEINYGPWDRLDGNAPFIPGVGAKPPGANFYPPDMDAAEFETAAEADPDLKSLYTMVRRAPDGRLTAIPYHEFFAERVQRAASLLREAATLADSEQLRRYLELRADALLTDEYQESDRAWMDMKDNVIDVVIGPIETYEDQLFGIKAANEAYILVKDVAWSRRLARFAELLPMLQQGLPVPEEYRREMPGTDSDLNAYDAIYYAGDCNAGSKTIAINLPNDEAVQLEKGTRRLQLKNALRAKFEEILVPISAILIAPGQRDHITFDAFFSNIMFHEVAHGLGVKNVLTRDETVREALGNLSSTIEEGKADVLGLFMVDQLIKRGEYEADVRDHYVTFLAGIFRSVRFGTSSAHGRANLVRFNFFKEHGAFTRGPDGSYAVDFEKMENAVNRLSEVLLRLQGDGDYESVRAFLDQYEQQDPELQADLARLSDAAIPVDIVFEQGLAALAFP